MEYARRIIPTGIGHLLTEAYRLLTALQREGPIAAGQAAIVRRAIVKFERDLEVLSRRMSARADVLVKETLDSRRVRPERTNDPVRLKDHIVSDPLNLGGLHAGVGVARIDEISKVPWWRAQEEGSRHMVGRTLYGYFYGADRSPGSRRAPSPGESRMHPVFETGKGRRMIVRNPIDPKFYLRDGSEAVGEEWRAAFEVIKADLVTTIAAAMRGGRAAPASRRKPTPGPRRRP